MTATEGVSRKLIQMEDALQRWLVYYVFGSVCVRKAGVGSSRANFSIISEKQDRSSLKSAFGIKCWSHLTVSQSSNHKHMQYGSGQEEALTDVQLTAAPRDPSVVSEELCKIQ